jgi:hypothetical protein
VWDSVWDTLVRALDVGDGVLPYGDEEPDPRAGLFEAGVGYALCAFTVGRAVIVAQDVGAHLSADSTKRS